MEDKRHPRIKELPFEVPENIDTDAFLFLGDPDGKTKTHFGRYWLTGSATLICAGSVVLGNVLSRRPAISGEVFYQFRNTDTIKALMGLY